MRVLAVASLLVAACGPPTPVERPVPAPRTIQVDPRPEAPKKSGWSYHPPEPAPQRDALRLPDGAWLLVGDAGERWLQPEGEGTARAAASRPAEALVQVRPWRGPEGRWLFLGERGGTYFASEPLGPLHQGPPAPRRLRSMVPLAGSALAADVLGELHRFDGAVWAPVDTSTRIFDLAAADQGSVVGLALPEALLHSEDGGEHWAPFDASARVGAVSLDATAEGVVVTGAEHRYLLGDDGAARPFSEELPVPPEVKAPRGPSGAALASGAADLDEDRYAEIDVKGGRWLTGRLGEPLATHPLELKAPCAGPVVARRGPHLWLACTEVPERSQQRLAPRAVGPMRKVPLFHSPDAGRSTRRVGEVSTAHPAHLALAALPSGRVLVTAACPTAAPTCSDAPPLWVDAGGKVVVTKAPGLVGPSFSPAVEGDHAYFLGERSKDGQTALFVSRAGGPFDPIALSGPAAPLEGRGGEAAWSGKQRVPRSLHPGGGVLGIVAHLHPPQYALASESGRVEALAVLPDGTVDLAAHGDQLLVVAMSHERRGELELWQSLDRGVSFQPVTTPLPLTPSELQSAVRGRFGLACSDAGCVLGDRHTRLGWDLDVAPSLAPAPDRVAPPRPVADLATCQPAGDWTSVGHLASGMAMPDAGRVFRGEADWSMLRDQAGLVETVTAVTSPKPRVERERLFAPPAKRARWAYDLAPQMEGYAAARLDLDRPEPILEVAWVNHHRREQGRGRIPDAGPLAKREVTPGATPHLVTGLLSVGPAALIVKPSREDASVFVVDLAGNTTTGRYGEAPATLFPHLHADASLVDGQLLSIAMFRAAGDSQAS
ncbi:MAG: hypothetical protein KC731_18760, partial [Myxococcales bacterium]|nr:hypothetical protein [Myxococcales bacterium]